MRPLKNISRITIVFEFFASKFGYATEYSACEEAVLVESVRVAGKFLSRGQHFMIVKVWNIIISVKKL